jgi:hypothetical protein
MITQEIPVKHQAIILISALLAACNVHSKSGDNDNVDINADSSGHIAFNLPFAQGRVKVPAGMMHNGNFDIDGVKLMPGSSVTGFSLDAHDKGSTINLAFTAPASPDVVRSYFVSQFKQNGIEAALAGDSVTGKSKDGSPFTIQVAPAANGSKGTITVEDKG